MQKMSEDLQKKAKNAKKEKKPPKALEKKKSKKVIIDNPDDSSGSLEKIKLQEKKAKDDTKKQLKQIMDTSVGAKNQKKYLQFIIVEKNLI